MVTCVSLLQSRAATSQVSFRTSVFIWPAPGSSRKSGWCKCRTGSVLLVHGAGPLLVHKLVPGPENLGGDVVDGPTSIWEAQEVWTLDGVNDAQRGAQFLCSRTASLCQIDTDLLYNGSLPPSCQCSPPHPPLRGLDSREEFHSSSSPAFGESFWLLCVAPLCATEYTNLREGEAVGAYSGTHASAHSPVFFFFCDPRSLGPRRLIPVVPCLSTGVRAHCPSLSSQTSLELSALLRTFGVASSCSVSAVKRFMQQDSKGHEKRRSQLEKRVNMGDGKCPVAHWQQKREAMHTIGMVVQHRHDGFFSLFACRY